MRRKTTRKLVLSSQTLRRLGDSHLRSADGGLRFTTTSGDTFTCPPPTQSCIIVCHTL